jgi:hypothetical protein
MAQNPGVVTRTAAPVVDEPVVVEPVVAEVAVVEPVVEAAVETAVAEPVLVEPAAESDPAKPLWTPDFDAEDDLGGLLNATSPLLSRAFSGRSAPRPKRTPRSES